MTVSLFLPRFSYGDGNADDISDFDCLVIPGLTYRDPDEDPSTVKIEGDKFCGRSLSFFDIAEPAATVCSK